MRIVPENPLAHSLGELGLIERLAARCATTAEALRLGIGDDAAVLANDGRDLVVTKDLLLEGVHFRREWTSARDLGWKALAVNLSDLAAMGANPVAALVGLGLPHDVRLEWVMELYDGIDDLARAFNVPIGGGDTTASASGVVLSISAIGRVAPGGALLRSGARAGDAILVTGTLGDSAAGLALLQSEATTKPEAATFVLARHRRPQPRLREISAAMQVASIHSLIDLSDGLAGDGRHVAERSNVALVIDAAAVPISSECQSVCARLQRDPLALALCGGEDYELLLTVDERDTAGVIAAIESSGTRATRIGSARAGEPGVWLRRPDGSEAALQGGFEHFHSVTADAE